MLVLIAGFVCRRWRRTDTASTILVASNLGAGRHGAQASGGGHTGNSSQHSSTTMNAMYAPPGKADHVPTPINGDPRPRADSQDYLVPFEKANPAGGGRVVDLGTDAYEYATPPFDGPMSHAEASAVTKQHIVKHTPSFGDVRATRSIEEEHTYVEPNRNHRGDARGDGSDAEYAEADAHVEEEHTYVYFLVR